MYFELRNIYPSSPHELHESALKKESSYMVRRNPFFGDTISAVQTGIDLSKLERQAQYPLSTKLIVQHGTGVLATSYMLSPSPIYEMIHSVTKRTEQCTQYQILSYALRSYIRRLYPLY